MQIGCRRLLISTKFDRYNSTEFPNVSELKEMLGQN